MTSTDLPALDVDASAELYLARTAPPPRRPYLIGVLAVFAALPLLPLVRVSVSVSAPGVLRPLLERHEILAPAEGVVAKVGVHDGQRVEPGSLILALAPGSLAPRGRALEASVAAARMRISDLEELIAKGPDAAKLRTGELQEAALKALREHEEHRLEAGRARRVLARQRRLDSLGLATLAELEDAASRAAQAAAETELARAAQRRDWQAALTRERENLRSAAADLSTLRQQRRRLLIRSPVGGTVVALAPLSPGSFVAAGEHLAVVSPGGTLVAEAYVAPRDVGLLRPGGAVHLLVDAFQRTRRSSMLGRIESVADDFTLLDGRPVFRVRCTLDPRWPGAGIVGGLRKGTPLRARFPVARRTLLSLLYGRVDALVHGATADPPLPSGAGPRSEH